MLNPCIQIGCTNLGKQMMGNMIYSMRFLGIPISRQSHIWNDAILGRSGTKSWAGNPRQTAIRASKISSYWCHDPVVQIYFNHFQSFIITDLDSWPAFIIDFIIEHHCAIIRFMTPGTGPKAKSGSPTQARAPGRMDLPRNHQFSRW